MNENQANYAKIGLFLLTGFTLLLVVIGIAGARVFKKQVVLAETYFTESVTGLDIGSPVKYRGVPVGEVSRIGFVFSEYGRLSPERLTFDGARQILVVMALDPLKFGLLRQQAADTMLQQMVGQGLRVKLASSGVTGLSFLEMDYFTLQQGRESANPVSWQPNHPYIPSSPSTMFAFKQAMDDVFVKLNGIDIQALGDKLIDTLSLIQNTLHRADIATLSTEATALLKELRETNQGIKQLLSSPEIAKLPADLGATVGSARRMTATLENQLDPLLQSVKSVTERAHLLAATIDGIATNTGGQVEETVAALRQSAQALNRTTQSQQNALAELIQNLRNASEGLDLIVSDVRANPSVLFFSKPPEPLPETQGTVK